MSLSKSEKLALDALLAKGDLLGAQNLLAGKTHTPAVEPPSPASPAPPPAPRTFEQILVSIVETVYSLLGSNPALQPYLEELRAVVSTPVTDDEE